MIDNKSDESPVTIADREAEAAMRRVLAQREPATSPPLELTAVTRVWQGGFSERTSQRGQGAVGAASHSAPTSPAKRMTCWSPPVSESGGNVSDRLEALGCQEAAAPTLRLRRVGMSWLPWLP